MRVPLTLLLFSLLAGATSAFIWGFNANNGVVFSALCAVAALILIVWPSGLRPGKTVVIDGSNVLYWVNGTPNIDAVAHVVEMVKDAKLTPIVWFDANVGYLIGQHYLGPSQLAKRLGLPRSRVFVAPKGKPADAHLLKTAARQKGRVISNDNFRDWAEQFPVVTSQGFLVKGRYEKGGIYLDL